MDLSELKPSERIVEILHPKTEVPVGVRVTLISMDDDRLKKIKRRIHDQKLSLEVRGKNFKSDDIEDNMNMITFSAMLGWEWYGADVKFRNEKPAFNQKNVLDVFETLPWFRQQVQEAVSDEKAFFQI